MTLKERLRSIRDDEAATNELVKSIVGDPRNADAFALARIFVEDFKLYITTRLESVKDPNEMSILVGSLQGVRAVEKMLDFQKGETDGQEAE